MPVNDNEEIFAQVSRDFVVRYIAGMALMLHREEAVDFDLNNVTPDADTLLFTFCFSGIAAFEDQNTIAAGDTTYVPRAVFEIRPRPDPATLLIGDTLLHGMVGDDTIAEALADARQSI